MHGAAKSKAGRSNASAKTMDLAADAANMEAKLLELRRAMEKERAKREAIGRGGAADGPIWRNGANGLLRSNFRSKQGSGASTGADNSRSTSEHASRASSAHRIDSAHSTSSAHRPDPARAGSTSTSSSAAAATAAPHGGYGALLRGASPPAAPELQPSIAGSRLASLQAAAAAGSPARVAASLRQGQGASTSGRRADVLTVHSSQHQVEPGGMACGTEDDSSLIDGQFNEADSHRSFLDALNEWRAANRQPAQEQQQQPARPKSATAAPIEVQTEAAPRPARPASAKQQLSLFDKLLLNSASRQAGQAASGGEASTQRSQGNSSGGGARPASSGSAPQPPLSASTASPSSAGAAAAARAGASAPQAASSSHTASLSTSHSMGQQAPSHPHDHHHQQPSGGSSSAPSGSSRALELLDRLEKLELEMEGRRQAALQQQDDDGPNLGSPQEVEVTTQTGMLGLTKGVRLPDAILVPTEAEAVFDQQ